ncbi:hypothetical protein V7148_18245 [Gottfriedia acidiceleris]|uniref:hypothetical protein n=1 Tax=Bacillaceae TaxID=186817 RepID=UPI00159690DD|nr:hypothetical protein [Bacillus sp. AFS096315]
MSELEKIKLVKPPFRIFSLGYYLLVSATIYGMSVFHNGTVLAMPLYFLALGVVMLLISLPLLYKKGAML